jgi:tRNA (guanine-N7-)-methyltransferase
MRNRHKKHAKERLDACGETVVHSTALFKDNPSALFCSNAPVHLEIGCGKGDFICGMANLYPEINFIAIERVNDVLVTAAEKVKGLSVDNVRLCRLDAAVLADIFPKGSIERIYLNFSDPWLKKRHYKRRLSHNGFLQIYKSILTENGSVFMKTDNNNLFEFSLLEFQNDGWRLVNVTYDLYKSGFEPNIVTEYEKRFSSQGIKIKRLEAYVK